MTVALSLKGVSKRFAEHQAVAAVSIDVREGESVAILGPSGSGKTTLLRLAAGLETPDDGDVWVAGIRVASAGRNVVPPYRRGIGFVFQDLALWPHLTVRQHLDFVLDSASVPREQRAARALEALTLVRIEQLDRRYPHQLSGGEQQRAALARALVARPRLLLLDEPLSSLDRELGSGLRAELRALQRSLKMTSVCVTHEREDAAALADRVVEMRAGRIASPDV